MQTLKNDMHANPKSDMHHSRKNRPFFGDDPKNRDFFWLSIFRPEKIAIFSKNRTSRKIGKHRQKLGKNRENRKKSGKIGKNREKSANRRKNQ